MSLEMEKVSHVVDIVKALHNKLKKWKEQVMARERGQKVHGLSSSQPRIKIPSIMKEKMMRTDDARDLVVMAGNPVKSRLLGVDTAPPSQQHKQGSTVKVDWIDVICRTARKDNIEKTYVFGGPIGKGGFGSVRLCKHKESGVMFACKTIRKGNPEEIVLVHQEVDIMIHLSGYVGVVCLKEFYEEPRRFHVVMELCPGGRLLDQIVSDGGRCSERKAASIIKEIMLIINYCHGMGVVHRDIKPANILISASGSMKLADFGTAIRVTEGKSLSGVVGTPSYTAPEILEGKYSKNVDIWSAGILLHLLLVGSLPFQGDSWEAISIEVKHGILNLNVGVWNDISAPARDLLGKMLSVDAKSRLTGAKVLAHPWILFHTQQKLKTTSKLKPGKSCCRS